MIKWLMIAGGAVGLGIALLAQSANPPVFKTGTRLVEISILATEGDNPVLNLSKDNFRVRDNKQDQIVSFFIPPSASLTSSTARGSETAPGSAAIVLDWLNMGFAEKAYARQKTINMLKAIGLSDRVALFANFRTLRLLHNFTDNNGALLESLSSLRPDVDSPETSAIFGTRDMDAFAAIDHAILIDATKRNVQPVIEMLRRQPGRKSLIWVSNAFYVPTADLIRANITVYTVDARGVQTRPLPAAGNLSGSQAAEAFEARMELGRRESLRRGAESTGGVYFESRNDLDGAMREALAETHASYTLGYYVPENTAPGEHKIQIDVNRRGVKLRYRMSYTAEAQSQ
jgi:VWFA-related protein